MRATFSGFEIAKTGIQSAETGLDVTGQNIAKMNTEGYSRQTVEQSSVYFESSSYKYAPVNNTVVGQGVSLDKINQIRDQFLDSRFRTANSQASELKKLHSILSGIENIIDETLTDGLGSTLEEFYKSLQTLVSNAGDIEYSGLTRSSAKKMIESLNYYIEQLNTVKEQEEYDLSVTVDDVNTLLKNIDKMNRAIQVETLNGNPTNELLDTRNLYFDKLSENLEITTISNADGTVSVMVGGEYLVDPQNSTYETVSLQNTAGYMTINAGGTELSITSGTLKGYLDALNGKGAYATAGENNFNGIQYYKSMLDDFAASFADTMNDLNGAGKPLFEGNTAESIAISPEWLEDANFITCTILTTAEDGACDNILRMINTLDSDISITPYFNGTFDEFVKSMMSDIAIDTKYVSDVKYTAAKVLSSIDNQRESIKGVSLNEETVNLLKYQKAFEASSRVITALDEMLDTIINKMGTVGR
ncbi:MAG: flagellar hook-associated protein FlgK [Eubacteriales bacterium]|nr:flagellar hook-associated protein FlgK [Eubacteriales bacterium]